MRRSWFYLFVFVLLMLSGCSAAGSEPDLLEETVGSTAAPTLTPTQTLTPTLVPTATMIPTPTLVPTPTATPLPSGGQVISPENAGQVALLDWLTYGAPYLGFDVHGDGAETLGYVMVTRTHLVGYSNQGERLYQLTMPDFNFFDFMTGSPLPLAIAENGRYMVKQGEGLFALDVYDLATGEIVRTVDHLENFPDARFQATENGEPNIGVTAFSPNAQLLAVAYVDNTVSIWDVQTGEEYSLPNTYLGVQRMAFSSDNHYFAATFGWQGSLAMFDISDFSDPQLVLVGSNVGHLVLYPFSPDNQYLLTSFNWNTSKYGLFDLNAMELVDMVRRPEGSYPMFSLDGQYVILDDWQEGTYLAKELLTYQELADQEAIVEMIPVYSNIAEILTRPYDKTIQYSASKITVSEGAFISWAQEYLDDIYDFAENVNWEILLKARTNNLPELEEFDIVLQDVPFQDTRVINKFTPFDAGILFCIGTQLEKMQSGSADAPAVLAEDCASPWTLAYEPVQNLVAYPSGRKSITILDAESGETRFEILGLQFYDVVWMKFSQDGNRLAIESTNIEDGAYSELIVFSLDYETGQVQRVWEVVEKIHSADFSSDGSYFAYITNPADGNSSLTRIDLRTEVAHKSTQDISARLVAFSPDGQILAASGYWDGDMYFLDTESLEILSELPTGSGETVLQIIFSPDGKSLYVRAGDAVSVWGLP